ncbi:HlyD family secretion protein [Acetobacter vaccinii]|uniref:HlyD family secretion protein n=1 Tax=Acetobacter vaccinii TaxID=2592655 RepID=A0A5C1YJI3_9PROT|nr:HlyD family secretion protein [Acetobacter vaccinii]QEO16396.1 HlyD family secretion protein [Acetobacter vaccinii]
MAEDHNEQSPPESGAQAAPQKKGSSRGKVILGGVIAVLVVCAALYWFLTRNEVETDDAFTAGRAVSIAPHVEGYVVELLVNDNQFVRKGQVLARIDPRDWQASRDQAAATLAGAEAHVSAAQMMHEVALLQYPGKLIQAQGQLNQAKARELRAQADYRRQRSVERAATSQQDIDYARAALDMAHADVLTAQGAVQMAMPVKPNINNAVSLISENEAQVQSARAQLVEAELNLEWTVIRAPTDGWISQRNVEQGNYARKGQSLFAIVEPVVWIVANYKETQITNIRPGQKVDVRVDAYPSLRLHGHVDSIQKGTGATFSAFPPENATGNYVKIVQRVPVKILIDDGLNPDQPLALGLSVEPTVHVDTAGRSDAPPPASVQAAP